MIFDSISIFGAVLDYASLAFILALVLAAMWLAPTESSANLTQCRYLLLTALIISALSAIIDLIFRSAALADVPPLEAMEFIPKVITQSDYGFFWVLRAISWLAMVSMLIWIWFGGRGIFPCIILLAGTLATALLISTTSHAGDNGIWTLENLINWLHLIGIAAWGGAVLLYAFVILPGFTYQTNPLQIAATVSRLSSLATVALVVVILTGIFNSWRQLGEISDLWNSEYGQMLLIKLALVSIMMSIGAMNRLHFVPQIELWSKDTNKQGTKPVQKFHRLLRVDSIVFITILIAAVILGMQSPPSHNAM